MQLVNYKKIKEKTGHFHEKSWFSVILAPWGQFKTLKIWKNLFIFYKSQIRRQRFFAIRHQDSKFNFLLRHSHHTNGYVMAPYKLSFCHCN